MADNLILVAPLLAIAAAFFIAATVSAVRMMRFLRRAVATEGTVVDLIEHGAIHTTYRAVVEFALESGSQRFADSMSSRPSSFQRGERVHVLYSPTEPGEARIATTFRLWGAIGFLFAMGSVFAGAAMLVASTM